MAVTPNYSWPIPVATDYVKDGWDAIADLGNAIDTTVAGLGSGLTKIASNTFSAQASVSFNNVFSSTYTHYRIVTNIKSGSGGVTQYMRLRASGSDDSGANYGYANYRWAADGTNNYAANNNGTETRFILADFSNVTEAQQTIDIANPNRTTQLRFSGTAQGEYAGVSGIVTFILGGYLGTTTAYDGFTIYPSSSTITGSITVYGYQL